MSFNCLGTDNTHYEVEWVYMKKAWVPAITVCSQRLFSTSTYDSGTYLNMEIVELSINEDNEASIAPNANRTIYRFPDDTLTGIVSITASDLANCEIGDEIVFIFELSDPGVGIDFSTDFFIDIPAEGDHTELRPDQDVYVQTFTFDGYKFISSYEFC